MEDASACPTIQDSRAIKLLQLDSLARRLFQWLHVMVFAFWAATKTSLGTAKDVHRVAESAMRKDAKYVWTAVYQAKIVAITSDLISI